MTNKTLGIILEVIGVLLVLIIVLEPALGLVAVIGHARKYWAILILGILAIIAGVIAFFSKGKKSGTGA